VQIVAFRNGKELRQFAPMFEDKPIEFAGLFQQGSDRSFILLDVAAENPWTVVFHEYAHQFQLMNGNPQGEFDPGSRRVLPNIFPASRWTTNKPA
jgi:hypothetical protein